MFGPFRKQEGPFRISIGIATFEKRFEDYFVPLAGKDSKSFEGDSEIVVAINGEHKRAFGEDYRRRILEFMATQKKDIPHLFSSFQKSLKAVEHHP
jgi:hypothetical protein